MVREKWSEFQLANKKDEEEGYGGNSGEESWKKVVVAIILDGLGESLPHALHVSTHEVFIDPADKAVLEYVHIVRHEANMLSEYLQYICFSGYLPRFRHEEGCEYRLYTHKIVRLI